MTIEERAINLIEQAGESGDPQQWMLYYTAAIIDGSDEDEAAALADLALQED